MLTASNSRVQALRVISELHVNAQSAIDFVDGWIIGQCLTEILVALGSVIARLWKTKRPKLEAGRLD